MPFTLETNRLLLKIENENKAEEILAFYQKNADLFDLYEPTRPDNFYTLTYQKAAVAFEYNEIIKGKNLRYYIYKKEAPDLIIGSVNFARLEYGPFSHASIGYKIDKDYLGNGYATESCQAAISVIFSNYNLHRIEARVSPDNIPSIKLLEHLNFQYEGLEYQSVEVNGVFKDHHRYSLLNTL